MFVHDVDDGITIYGYPKKLFPPTDFHTATLVGNHIYVIGSLGYRGERNFGTTQVFRLDIGTWKMKRLITTGESPGWIHRHRAVVIDDSHIAIDGGNLSIVQNGLEKYVPNDGVYILDIDSLTWDKRI